MKATHIVVIQSGWVFVGIKAPTPANAKPGDIVTLTNAACVRKWGTSRGIGELALSGPLSETVLDPAGTVEVPLHAVHFFIPVDQTKWTA